MKLNAVVALATFISTLIGCSEPKTNTKPVDDTEWKTEAQVLKRIENVNFNFPANGNAFDNKNDLVKECFEAMESNLQLIELSAFTDTIQIRFLRSRKDMKVLTGMGATGIAQPHINTLYVVADSSEKVKPPIKHELMHLIAMLKWGYPHYNSTWINEGLAALAENNCNGYNVAEIYRYLLETDKLIHVDSLTTSFYSQSEMISYHQSAYVVEYLLKNYSIEQFKRFWSEGFEHFESIYGIGFQEMKTNLEKSVTKQYPDVPNIDWESFEEGCMK
ncbi:MAG: hypothetical protein ACI9P8_001656 [Bacteroidia bacterium]|jgi:hypothetical protein